MTVAVCHWPFMKWDDMSSGTYPFTWPWDETWDRITALARTRQIDRLLAWGDSQGHGACRIERAGAAYEVRDDRDSCDFPLADLLLESVRLIAGEIASAYEKRLEGPEGFFCSGRDAFSFNVEFDLRDCISLRAVIHTPSACGTVFVLLMYPARHAKNLVTQHSPANPNSGERRVSQ